MGLLVVVSAWFSFGEREKAPFAHAIAGCTPPFLFTTKKAAPTIAPMTTKETTTAIIMPALLPLLEAGGAVSPQNVAAPVVQPLEA